MDCTMEEEFNYFELLPDEVLRSFELTANAIRRWSTYFPFWMCKASTMLARFAFIGKVWVKMMNSGICTQKKTPMIATIKRKKNQLGSQQNFFWTNHLISKFLQSQFISLHWLCMAEYLWNRRQQKGNFVGLANYLDQTWILSGIFWIKESQRLSTWVSAYEWRVWSRRRKIGDRHRKVILQSWSSSYF